MSYVKGESDVNPTESETTSMVGNFPNGSREIPAVSNSSMELDRSGKARCHNPDMHASGKSDKCVVPEKSANLDGLPPSSESMEERHLTNEKAEHKSLDRAQNRNKDGKPSRPRSRGLLGIREAAKKDKEIPDEAERLIRETAKTNPCGYRRNRILASVGLPRLVSILRGTGQLQLPGQISKGPPSDVAPHDAATQSARETSHLEEVHEDLQSMAPQPTYPPSVS